MAIKNTKLNGSDVDDEQITDYDFNDTINATANICESDQTGGSINNSTTETKIGEVILDAATAVNGVIIIATGWTETTSGFGGNDADIKLYTGTNAAFASNDVRKTFTTDQSGNGKGGWTLIKVLTSEETWTGQVYIQITGKNKYADNAQTVGCESVVVMGIGGSN